MHRTTVAQPREVVRDRSKLLFGNRDKLEVLSAIGGLTDQALCAADIESRVGLANNRVRAQLIILAKLGLLIALPRGRGERIQWYQRVPSPLWSASAALYEEWGQQSASD
jgi:hypothetical protein